MKDLKLKVVAPKEGTIFGELGITSDRKDEVIKATQKIIKKNNEDDDKTVTDSIVDVWNAFDKPEEVAFAMYILQHEGEEVEVHQLFRLPEAVGEEEKA